LWFEGNNQARRANEGRLHKWFPLCSIERHLAQWRIPSHQDSCRMTFNVTHFHFFGHYIAFHFIGFSSSDLSVGSELLTKFFVLRENQWSFTSQKQSWRAIWCVTLPNFTHRTEVCVIVVRLSVILPFAFNVDRLTQWIHTFERW
jgi:hypothetical protein